MRNPFRYFNSSPEVIRLVVMMYIRYPLSLRQVEDILFERGIDISHETIRFWWNRFGPMFAAEIRKRRIQTRAYSQWRWHLDEVFVRHCQTNLSRPAKGAGLRRSSRQLTPLGQGDRTVLFEDIAAVDVAVVVEVVVDRGVDGGELLESFHVSKLRHRSFSSSERQV